MNFNPFSYLSDYSYAKTMEELFQHGFLHGSLPIIISWLFLIIALYFLVRRLHYSFGIIAYIISGFSAFFASSMGSFFSSLGG